MIPKALNKGHDASSCDIFLRLERVRGARPVVSMSVGTAEEVAGTPQLSHHASLLVTVIT